MIWGLVESDFDRRNRRRINFRTLQVRQGNIKRRDQAAITLIQTLQDESWARGLDLIDKLPENATRAQRALTELGVRLETVGYLVFRRSIDLQSVDDLIGGITLGFWSRAKCWAERGREISGNPKYAEWVEWLVDRISERRNRLGHEPAHRRYADWRE